MITYLILGEWQGSSGFSNEKIGETTTRLGVKSGQTGYCGNCGRGANGQQLSLRLMRQLVSRCQLEACRSLLREVLNETVVCYRDGQTTSKNFYCEIVLVQVSNTW